MKTHTHQANIRNNDTTTVKDAMNAMLKSYNIKKKFDETSLIVVWPKIMGKVVANRTSNIYIKNNVMVITLNSAPLKHELNNSKAKILELFEKEYGKSVVKDILFI